MLDAIWAAEGAAYSFGFRDGNDWAGVDQVQGIGDGTSNPIQLIKSYTKGSRTKVRDITLPTAVTMKSGGVPYTDFTVDEIGGLLSPTSTWPSGEVLTAPFEFDVCVRFANDYNPMIGVAYRLNEIMIELIEERWG